MRTSAAEIVAIEHGTGRPDGPRPPAGAALRRWSLRGVAFVYLGLFIALPVGVLLQHGFNDGLTSLRLALHAPGGAAAIRLTLGMATLTDTG